MEDEHLMAFLVLLVRVVDPSHLVSDQLAKKSRAGSFKKTETGEVRRDATNSRLFTKGHRAQYKSGKARASADAY